MTNTTIYFLASMMDAFQLVVEHSNIMMPGLRGSWLCVVYVSYGHDAGVLDTIRMQVCKQINEKKYNTM